MVYHSGWNGHEESVVIGCGIYPIKQSSKNGSTNGPAPKMEKTTVNDSGEEEENQDVLDEALFYFKSNILFRTYTMKGPGDRLMLYLTYFISQCLKKLVGITKEQSKHVLHGFVNEGFSVPGEKGFPFSAFYPPQANAAEAEKFKEYAKQLRAEMAARLSQRVYEFPESDGTPSKHWMIFAKYPLLGHTSC